MFKFGSFIRSPRAHCVLQILRGVNYSVTNAGDSSNIQFYIAATKGQL